MPTEMKLIEAIRGRRSVGRVESTPIDVELIQHILEAGNWAPSHHVTEPWRFFVMTGTGRNVLGEAYADIAVLSSPASMDVEQLAAFRAKHSTKAFRAPLVIAVSVSPSADPHISRIEEFAAAHAAVQNMMLMAHAIGLASIWRSGEPMYHPLMQQAFGLQQDEELVALLYIGIPDMSLGEGHRRPTKDKTTWLTDER